MAENSKIQWTHHTFNPWRGCTKVAPGCKNCYADVQAKRNPGTLGIWGDSGTRVVAAESMWREPLKWNRKAEQEGVRQRVFCASMADVFEDWQGNMVSHRGIPLHFGAAWGVEGQCYVESELLIGKSIVRMEHVRRRLFDLIDQTPNLDWLLVTKRPENIVRMWPQVMYPLDETTFPEKKYRDNVWLLTSVATQEDANKNIPELLKCRKLCPVLGISAEPLIEKLNLHPWLCKYGNPDNPGGWADSICRPSEKLDWVIVGGESGSKARPCNIDWIRSIVDQCQDASVPVFVKQLGAVSYVNNSSERWDWPGEPGWTVGGTIHDDSNIHRIQTVFHLNDRKGGNPDEWPEELCVRQFPVRAS